MALFRSIVFSAVLSAMLAPATARAQSADAASDASVSSDSLAALRARLERDPSDAGELQSIIDEARALARSERAPIALRGEALFYGADAADRALRFREALALYRASIELAPGGRFAARARARVSTLAPHEGDDFAGLTELARFRLRISSATVSELRAFAARASRWSASPARAQARLAAASALVRKRALEEAASVLRAVAEDPMSSGDDRAIALHELSRIRAEQGAFATARDELETLGADRGDIATASRLARRAKLYRFAWGALIAQWIVGLVAVARSVRARAWDRVARAWKRPLPLVHIAVLTVGGALLTRSYDHHDDAHVWAFGAAVLTVYFAASAASADAHRTRARARWWTVARVMIAVLAALSASFLAMHRFDQGMLDGISL
ncbi:MAG: hypothetical protein U0269_27040 [Polyangiales bacterium]